MKGGGGGRWTLDGAKYAVDERRRRDCVQRSVSPYSAAENER